MTEFRLYSVRPRPEPHVAREHRNAPAHEVKTGCCAGCCTSQPPRDQRGAHGETIRVNVNFTVTGCCGPALPFDPYDMQNIPYQLYNAGVTDEEWAEHVKRLVNVNKMRQAGCSFQCLLNCCLPMILPCLCPYFCQKCAKEVYAWDAVRE